MDTTEQLEKTKRLYVFTGKGGVGKTALSLAFCKYLKSQNKKCLYTYFKNSKIESAQNSPDESLTLANSLGVETLGLDLRNCARNYIAKKLNSKTIALWITKTPFFQSLLNMIPGFSYVIYLGQLLERMIDEPELIIVLDSPSSGHALTMLESTKNFNEIFQDGIVYEDTKLMLNILQRDDFTKVNIITLPTLLALHESQDLKSSIHDVFSYETRIHCNNCLNSFESDSLPEFLKSKIKNEEKALAENLDEITNQISYSMAQTNNEVIKDLVPSMQNLV
jgi:arsenite-transporting ATPase